MSQPQRSRAVTSGERVVFGEKDGKGTKLLFGDPEKDERGIRALPELLAEGWTVKQSVFSGQGVYFILSKG